MSVEALNCPRPPVILLGMHRSGTSLIARLLDELGLFQGSELQEDHESVYFLDVNDLILKRIGATWDNPGPARDFLRNSQALDHTARCLRVDLVSKHAAGYLGRKKPYKAGLEKLEVPWGWKDPRTVFTLPLWLTLFPKAKLVYIVRNGIDVAGSLRVRESRELSRRIAELDDKAGRRARHSLLERAGFKGSARCLTLEGGFSLWEEYVAEAEAALARLPNERVVINYERFLASPTDPNEGIAPLARFCGLSSGQGALTAAIGQIDVGRSKAFRADPELSAFYDQVKGTHWMKHYGYDAL